MTAAAELRDAQIADALGERYLSYAMSTIMARSLPDIRDGLKPVHRRILHAMRELGLDPRSGYKKAARVVGDVIGKFHPHGDQSVYDALVRLAQDFASRYPLVDGQGNFGNIDGDNAAAMRYTEARLTAVAEALLDGIDEDAVDLRPTYDGELTEPVVLPAAFPNLLANGANGIAVGMATSIPPHNAAELCAAALHLIGAPEASTAELMAHVQGPDFPTGGVLVEPPEAMRIAYETGRGSFRLRARWAVEKGRNGLYSVVVSEIPYQVQKGRLIERIAELLADRKLALLADIRDESTEDVRIVLEPKSRTVDPAMLMESLFRQSELEVRVPLNLNVVDAQGVPRVVGLAEALRGWLDHRQQVLIRRSRHRLAVIDRRLDVLRGHLAAYLNLDEVIRIIREEDEPKPVLIARFELNDVQAEAILNMRLRHLRRLEEMEIRREFDALSAERAGLEALLGDSDLRWQQVAAQIAATRDQFGAETPLGRRRTEIGGRAPVVDMPAAALVEREPITVLLSRMGWVRAVRGHDLDPAEVKYKEGDGPGFVVKAETTDRVLIAASDGRFYALAADKLPRGRGFGEPLRLTIDLGQDQELVAVMAAPPAGVKLLLAATDARGFLVDAGEVAAQTRAGRQVMTPADGARLAACLPLGPAHDHVAVIGTNRKLLLFPLAEVPELARGRGVILQKYQEAGLSDIRLLRLADGLEVPHGAGRRLVGDLAPWLGKRASAGRLPPHGFPRNNRFPE